MVRAHDADTDNADPQVRASVAFRGMQHGNAPSTLPKAPNCSRSTPL
jgi:hypothetical protein